MALPTDINPFVQFASASASADLGDPIEQSLRFRGTATIESQSLSTTSSTSDWSKSFWVKRGTEGASNASLFYNDTTAYPIGWWTTSGGGSGNIDSFTCVTAQSTTYTKTNSIQRDYSSWYHIYMVRDTARSQGELYINGVKEIDASCFWTTNETFKWLGYLSTSRDFYLADYHFVDGQALPVTTFGRYNSNGVWVPVDPKKDGDTAWYGTNGFHLDFADLSNVGKDISGNGNDFTATGFDTYNSGSWSGDLFVDDTNTATPNYNATSQSFTQPAANGFDGNLATIVQASSANVGNWLIFRPTTPITVNTSLRINTDRTEEVHVNGSDSGLSATDFGIGNYGWITIPITAPLTLSNLAIRGLGSGGSLARFTAIEVDGQILVDGTGVDFDYMLDTPTTNYATLNPIDAKSVGTLNANLSVEAAATFNESPGTICMGTENKYYAEANIDDTPVNPPNRQYGIILAPRNGWNGTEPYLSTDTYIIWVFSGTIFQVSQNNSAVVNGTLSAAPAAGSKIQCAYDAATRSLYAGINNDQWLRNDGTIANTFDASQPTIVLPETELGYSIGTIVYNGTVSLNAGQQPFKYTPPTGFKDLNTANIPTPTIKNGRDHFQAITRPGSGGIAGNPGVGNWATMLYSAPNEAGNTYGTLSKSFSTNNPPELGFDGSTATLAQPDATGKWVVFKPDTPIVVATGVRVYTRNYNNNAVYSINKAAAQSNPLASGAIGWADLSFTGNLTELAIRDNSTSNTRFYALEIDGNVYVSESILSAAQAAFPSGLWWIKDRANSNQHQLVDSVRGGNLALTSPTLGAEAAYTAPTGSSVAWSWNYDSSNPAQNGFEIITYTGNATVGKTVSHNLGKAPEFIITKERSAGGNYWCCYHVGGGVGYIYLNTSGAYQHNPSAPVMYTAVSDTTWTLDDNGQVNGNGINYVSYAWTSVPGYSAFGSYTGNSNADGPFVYTGFRPAFVLCKASNGTSSWFIWDSTRNTTNPAISTLYSDLDADEDTSIGTIDIVSNGFKFRQTGTNMNISGSTYVYAAFAENPFGGENQPPATAR